jgi:hypothetical protein
MKKLLIFTSVLETILGIFLIIDPSLVFKLLLGIESTSIIEKISRLTGIVYLCFGAASYPVILAQGEFIKEPSVRAMFLYNLLAAVYLGYLKFAEKFTGEFLLPAVVLHFLITIYFLYLIIKQSKS